MNNFGWPVFDHTTSWESPWKSQSTKHLNVLLEHDITNVVPWRIPKFSFVL